MFFSALCSLAPFLIFFRPRAKQQAGWSQGTGAYVLDMSPPLATSYFAALRNYPP
jgi:hypothetical protein